MPRIIKPRDFTDEEAIEFRAALRDPEKWRQLHEKVRLESEALEKEDSNKRKMEEQSLLDKEEMEILKRSRLFEDEAKEPLLNEEEMEILKSSKVFDDEEEKEKEQENIDLDDYLKDFDYGGKAVRKSRRRKGGRKNKHTKKHQRKSKTHKRRKMHNKRRTHSKH